MQNRERGNRNNTKNKWRLSLDEVCLINSQGKINQSSWSSKNEESNSRSTSDKQRNYGSKNYMPIDLKNRENSRSMPKQQKIQNGSRNRFSARNKDFLKNIYPILKDLCQKNQPNYPVLLILKKRLIMDLNLKCDQPIII